MNAVHRALLAAGAMLALAVGPVRDAWPQDRPLPGEAFLEEVRANMARADREQYHYAYRERRSEVHANPFGKLGTDGTLLYQVTPGEEYGIYYKQLIGRDGKPVTEGERNRVDRRGRPEESPSVADVVNTLSFKMERRENNGGRDYIVVSFEPKPNARPRTRQGKMAKAFAGTIWIDEAAREVARIEATSVDSISYGGGLLARVGPGAQVKVVREQIDDTNWMPTSVRLKGEGRAVLMIRKLNIDFFIEWFDYKRNP